MMRIEIACPRKPDGSSELHIVEMPCVPQKGDYLSSDKLDFAGYVQQVSYWWDEKDNLYIEARIK